jgi:hypothetical protein
MLQASSIRVLVWLMAAAPPEQGHHGMLAASLNHLVARGELRCGIVICILEYFAGFIRNQKW